ncbi:putative inactive receptor-like protein kinase [Cucumis melo var. makuwa]|uniref:Inactive receptor-like protein kinase n=1 Tax=Cucumis melo var. makuwa TaxID=1194695 RepID=A0A5A7T9J7_CUCMM|nr:putative inactive receptor-like protein kinase [Cucumis melo var. makuwa]
MSNASDSSILSEDSSTDPSFISQIFSSGSKISLVKLRDDNFLLWKFQILTTLEAYDLESYLESIAKPPIKYINTPSNQTSIATESSPATMINIMYPEYKIWKRQED